MIDGAIETQIPLDESALLRSACDTDGSRTGDLCKLSNQRSDWSATREVGLIHLGRSANKQTR